MNRIKSILMLLLLVVAGSCEKEDAITASSPMAPAGTEATASAGSQQNATLPLTKTQALAAINKNYEGKFSTIKLDQITKISRQQFTGWLQNTDLASSKKYLLPLLAHASTKYILIKSTTLLATGKPATVVLVVVPAQLIAQYAEVVTLVARPTSSTARRSDDPTCRYRDCNVVGQCLYYYQSYPSCSPLLNQCNDTDNRCTNGSGTWAFASLRTATAAF